MFKLYAVYKLSDPLKLVLLNIHGTNNFVNASGGGVKAVGGVFSEMMDEFIL